MEGFTEFYFVRHGESMGNVANILQGWGDAPLSENGILQARAVAGALADVKFDIAYSSTLCRAVETARIILEFHPGVELCGEDDLREWNLGDLDGRNQDELHTEVPALMWNFQHETGEIVVPGGETKAQFQARISGVLDRIARENIGKRVLVTSHGWASHRVFAHVYGQAANGRRFPVPDNASVSVFRFFPEDGSWLMVSWNMTEHLRLLPVRHNPYG